MKYAIELFFDKQTEEKLFHLSRKIAEKKLSTKYLEWKTRPHVTLACFNDVDEEKCAEVLRIFAKTHNVLPAYIGSVGMFPDTKTIFASPIMTSSTYRLQRELHECMKGFNTKGHDWYLPERWVPHCALALMSEDDSEAYYKACELVLRNFDKISGSFASVGLVKISFPVQEICVVKLADEVLIKNDFRNQL